MNEKRLARAVDNALAMKLVSWTELADLLLRIGKRGRSGTATFRRVVGERSDSYVPPAGEFEQRLRELIQRAGVAAPERQLWVYDEDGPIGRFDTGWRAERLILEADSRRHHMSLLDFENDRERDARLAAAGWRVMRVTWKQLRLKPREVEERLLRALKPRS